MNTQEQSIPDPHVPTDAARVATMFVIKLVVLTLLVGFGEGYLHQIGWGVELQETVARLVIALVSVVDSEVICEGNQIIGAGPVLLVTLQCTALFATGLFCAAVIAYPCSWSGRVVGLVVGLVGVAIVNVLRITSLVLIARYALGLLHFAHLVLMQGFLISCVAPLWLAWAVWTTRRAKRSGM